MDAQTKEQLYQLAALGRDHGLVEAVRWLMARIAEHERATRRRRRKRRVTLLDKAGRPVRGATFYVDESLLRAAVVPEEEGGECKVAK